MKTENYDRAEELLAELRVLEMYVRTAKKVKSLEGQYVREFFTAQRPFNLEKTSLYDPRKGAITNTRLSEAIANIDKVFIEVVNERIVEIEKELETL